MVCLCLCRAHRDASGLLSQSIDEGGEGGEDDDDDDDDGAVHFDGGAGGGGGGAADNPAAELHDEGDGSLASGAVAVERRVAAEHSAPLG